MIATVTSDKKPKPVTFKLKKAARILSAIETAVADQSPKSAAARAIVLELLRTVLADAHRGAEADLAANGKGMKCATNISAAQDEMLKAIHAFAVQRVYPVSNPSDAEALALAAVGGYGRGTLAPGSDIDLLFILPYKQTPWGEQVTEYVLYMLWDLGQKVGHAVRSVEDCLRMSRADMTVRTATLEARFLIGDQSLYDNMIERFEKEIVSKTGPEFIAAKLSERDDRHHQLGNTRYVVEPNIKEGKGGLRDLNTLFWIGKYFYRVKTGSELVAKGVFSDDEYLLFRRSEEFLWAVRCNLHFLTGRAEEKLTFDVQPDLAERMGYVGKGSLLAVERFMKRYFLVAKDVGDLTRIFSTSLEFAHAKKLDLVGQLLGVWRRGRAKIKGEKDFVIDAGRLSIANEDVFTKDPVNLIKLFWIASRQNVLFHPDALKTVTRSLNLINRDLRIDPRANGYFLDILTTPKTVERILRRMNEAGVLGKFVREFGKIVALMQFNMYHHFTVDEHLIRAVGVMAKIANGGLKEDLPLTHELLPSLADTRLLFVALFLHDIAKGRPEDHSLAGAVIARKLCPRFGLSAAETDTVAWLVEKHLVMSEVANSRDINDPETARNFAAIVQSPQRLALLMILTACDIRAVGPGTWSGWKGSLLRSLYFATEPLLSGGHSQFTQHERIASAQNALADALVDWPVAETDAYTARHYSAYWLRAEHQLHIEHANMIRKTDQAEKSFAGGVCFKEFEGITEISFYAADHPKLLSQIAGACTMCDASIIGAQIFSTRDGQALDTFRLRRAFPTDGDEEVRAARIILTVKQLLQGKRYVSRDLNRETRHNRRLRPFKVPAQVLISNGLSNKFTVIEVSGLDRTGLLHDLTSELFELSLSIGSAHISTYGEKAVDVFYVTDLTGAKIETRERRRKIHKKLMAVFEPAPAPVKKAKKKKAAKSS